MTVKELKEYLKTVDDNIELTIVVVDELGTKRAGVVDYDVDKKGMYITTVAKDDSFVYKVDQR